MDRPRGYMKDDEADIGFLYPKQFAIETFLAAARVEGVGITFAPSTRWRQQGIESYLRHTQRRLKSVSAGPGGTLALQLKSGEQLWAKSRGGRLRYDCLPEEKARSAKKA